MAKQAVDARYVEGKGGVYVAAAVADNPLAAGGELGVFTYPLSFLEGRVTLTGLAGTGAESTSVGVNTGFVVSWERCIIHERLTATCPQSSAFIAVENDY